MRLNLLHNDPEVLSLKIKKLKITTLKMSRQKYINHTYSKFDRKSGSLNHYMKKVNVLTYTSLQKSIQCPNMKTSFS